MFFSNNTSNSKNLFHVLKRSQKSLKKSLGILSESDCKDKRSYLNFQIFQRKIREPHFKNLPAKPCCFRLAGANVETFACSFQIFRQLFSNYFHFPNGTDYQTTLYKQQEQTRILLSDINFSSLKSSESLSQTVIRQLCAQNNTLPFRRETARSDTPDDGESALAIWAKRARKPKRRPFRSGSSRSAGPDCGSPASATPRTDGRSECLPEDNHRDRRFCLSGHFRTGL